MSLPFSVRESVISQVGALKLSPDAYVVSASPNHVLVGTSSGLVHVNATNPALPTVLGSLAIVDGAPAAISIVEDLAAVAVIKNPRYVPQYGTLEELWIVDLSGPSPVVRARVAIPRISAVTLVGSSA